MEISFNTTDFEKSQIKVSQELIRWINFYLPRFGINTVDRVLIALAQWMHETCGFKYSEEIADGRAYEGRRDLGNYAKGDGKKYKGRGASMLTGRDNYEAFTLWCKRNGINVDFVRNPELVALPKYSILSACWFWNTHNLNKLCDRQPGETIEDVLNKFDSVTLKINGGFNGLKSRYDYYLDAMDILQNKLTLQ